jgi:hypothetical protein
VKTLRRRSTADVDCVRAATVAASIRFQRPILAVEEQLVLAVEVVIEIRGRTSRRPSAMSAHARVGVAALTKELCRRFQDAVPLPVPPARARRPQRNANGRSIFEPLFTDYIGFAGSQVRPLRGLQALGRSALARGLEPPRPRAARRAPCSPPCGRNLQAATAARTREPVMM